jgi:hypothetical protein
MYGFAAVSNEPNPLPIMNVAPQKPPKLFFNAAGHIMSAPIPYNVNPRMKVARNP